LPVLYCVILSVMLSTITIVQAPETLTGLIVIKLLFYTLCLRRPRAHAFIVVLLSAVKVVVVKVAVAEILILLWS